MQRQKQIKVRWGWSCDETNTACEVKINTACEMLCLLRKYSQQFSIQLCTPMIKEAGGVLCESGYNGGVLCESGYNEADRGKCKFVSICSNRGPCVVLVRSYEVKLPLLRQVEC